MNEFGEKSKAMGVFGYEPPKVGRKSLTTKVHAAEKGRATRAARQTMGPKAKRKIRG
jgi:hypothetical protein